MTKLLITEITRMGEAFCVIGLEREGQVIRSVRPIPSGANGWASFPFRRGDIVEFSLIQLRAVGPHIEDRVSTRGAKKVDEVTEGDVVKYLRRAECAESLSDLFGCRVQENRQGSGLYVAPRQASRSICGCATANLRLERVGEELRTAMALPSGEVLRDLPVVDRDWNDFIDAALRPGRGANRRQRLERFLSAKFHERVMACPHHFVRLGLTRPFKRRCWVMLDTVFPLPRAEWLEEF